MSFSDTLLLTFLLLQLLTLCRGTDCHGNIAKVLLSGSVALICETSTEKDSLWVKDLDTHLFVERNPANIMEFGNVQLGRDYSLLIENIRIENEGIYTCKVGRKIVTSHCLKVFAAPVLMVSVDGLFVNRTIDVIMEEEQLLTCVAVGSKPKSSLQWGINGLHVTDGVTETSNNNDDGTFNSSISIKYRFTENVTHVECKTEEEFVNDTMSISAEMLGFVVPKLEILYNQMKAPEMIHVTVNSSCVLACQALPAVEDLNLMWIRNGEVIEQSETLKSFTVSNEDKVISTLHLEVGTNKKKEIMNITCSSSGQSSVQMKSTSVLIIFYEQPELELLLNDDIMIHRRADVLLGSCHTIKCTEKGGTVELISLAVEANELFTAENVSTKAVVKFCAESESAVAVCNAYDTFGNANISRKVHIKTVAVPKLSITFDGTTVEKFLHVFEKKIYTLNCIARDARPKAELTWVFGESVLVLEAETIKFDKISGKEGLWNSRNDLHFRLEGSSAIVTCIAVGHNKFQGYNRTITLLSQVSSLQSHSRSTPGTTCHLGIDEDKINLSIIEARKENKELQVSHRPSQKQQSVSLPKRPVSITSPEVYYSTLKEGSMVRNVYTKKEVCFVAQLKKGTMFTRWIGTIGTQKGQKSCVFISLPTGTRGIGYEFQWDVYVQKLMEIPDNMNVMCTKGLCIDGANLYLMQEYQPVGTLRDLLQTIEKKDSLSFAPSVLDLCLQVVKGMEFVVTHGFLHPGLCVEKILTAGDKRCKLYDFCLKDDASRRLIAIKSKPAFPELPPEAQARNEYSWGSDSWSVAMCVWEMLTYGTNQLIEKSMVMETTEYPPYFLECLMKSKSLEVADRPPLRDIRESLFSWMTERNMEVGEKEVTNNSSRESLADDGYTPMAGNVSFGETNFETISN